MNEIVCNGEVYNKIKALVTKRSFVLHQKSTIPVTLPPVTHWIQVASDPYFVPKFPADEE